MVERFGGACGQGLFMGARTKVPSSMRLALGYLSRRFLAVACSGGSHCSSVVKSKFRATKMIRSGLSGFMGQGELMPVFQNPLLGSAHSSMKPLWTRSEEHTSELQSQSNLVC